MVRRSPETIRRWRPLWNVLSAEDCQWLRLELEHVPPLGDKGPDAPLSRLLPPIMRKSYRLKPVNDALAAANRTWGLPRDPPHCDYSLVGPGHVPVITYAASVLLVDPG